jgi:hypothetical protein
VTTPRQRADCRVRHAVDEGAAEAVGKYVQAHDGMLLANHGALTLGKDLFSAYYKMETIEHFAKISLVARLLGGERLLSREEVFRLQDLRGRYGIAAPAPICDDPAPRAAADCQVVQAPSRPGSAWCPTTRRFPTISRALVARAHAARQRPCRPGNSANIRGTHGTD